jgi:hypothetical protein
MFEDGRRVAEIGRELGRHDGAIRSRLVKLGLLTEDDPAPARRGSRRAPDPVLMELPAISTTDHIGGVVPGWGTIQRRLTDDF